MSEAKGMNIIMTETIIGILQSNLSAQITQIEVMGTEIYAEVKPEYIFETYSFIYKNIDCTILSLFANDERPFAGCFRVYYAFAIKKAGVVLVLRTKVDIPSVGLPSISTEIPAAALAEREVTDMFGIVFRDHPDPRELVLHGNWPEGLHPLKKDYNISFKPGFTDRKQKFLRIDGSGVFEIPVGPVHAGIIEPGHFRFSVAGEPIINLEAKLYYVHKGIEKLSENQSFEKTLFLSERISGDETVSNSLAYCLALEKMAGMVKLPDKADYTRTVLCELERIYNHIGDIAGICIDAAYGFAAYQLNMMRRWCMILNEELTGSRFLRSSIKPGGVRRDYLFGKEKHLFTTLEKLETEFMETMDIIRSNSLLIDRVENTGVLKHETAVDLNALGPAGRSAGIDKDARRDFPYSAYPNLRFTVPLHNNGDVNCRMNIKAEEIKESISIIKQCIEMMPLKEMKNEPLQEISPYSCAFGITESPRGENCHFIMSGEKNTVYRYKIRTPSFFNWPVLCLAVKGNIVPDFPLINKSFNLSYSGNDL